MSPKYESLFNVHFKHEFFDSGNLDQIVVKPTNATMKTLRDYELICRSDKGKFSIHHPTTFASESITRNNILSDNLDLDFTLQCADKHLMSYTKLLPQNIENKMFLFQYPTISNESNKLHSNNYVSEIDLIDFRDFEIPYFSKPFGHLRIKTDENTPIDNYIQFATPSLYWRYIIRTSYLLDYPGLAITNKSKTVFFDGPSPIILPNGDSALSFISPSIIPQKQFSSLTWQLIEQYQKETNYGKVVIPNLPQPNHKSISFLGEENKIKGEKRILDIIV
jgi:hypothetical protein